MTTLTKHSDHIAEDEGDKAVPLVRPTTPAPRPERADGNVLALRRRATG